MNKDWESIQQSKFFVTNKRTNLKIIPYIGCKAGFNDIFDRIIPDNLVCPICDIFGGGGAFSLYACNRFGSHQVTHMKIEAFVTRFGFSDNFKHVLEKSTIRKAKNLKNELD